MRSRAELRRTGELVLRTTLFAALGVALWRSLPPVDVSATSRAVSVSALGRDLDAMLTDPVISAVDLTIDAMPSSTERALLVALRRAGVPVRWHGSPPALAIEAVRVREPDERTRLLVTGGGGAPIVLADSAGVLDSIRGGSVATVDVASVVGAVRAEQGRFAARAVVGSSGPRRAVLVLGRADWESKFVMSALSEAGWLVRASIPAP